MAESASYGAPQYKANDLLAEWISKWMTQAMDKSSKGAHRKAILAQGTMRFRDDERYRNDERYLKLWMAYADLTDDASKVFHCLHSKKFFTDLALFWAAWAYVLEMGGFYSAAADALAEGIARGALPVAVLQECRQGFEDRMCDRMKMACSGHSATDWFACAVVRSRECTGVENITAAITDAGVSGDQQTSTPAADFRARQQGKASNSQSGCTQVETRINPSQRLQTTFQSQPRYAGKTCENTGSAGVIHVTVRSRKALGSTRTRVETFDKFERRERASPRTPLRVRDGNTPALALPNPSKNAAGSNAKARLHTVVGSASTARAFVLVQDPVAKDQRRRMTTDTVEYRRWARSCKMVHNARHESLGAQWSRKMGKVKHGPRQQPLARHRLGTKSIDVLGLLGKGSFADVFSCKVVGKPGTMAVKIEREEKAPTLPWECFIILQLHERLRRLPREGGDCLYQLSSQVVKPDGVFFYRDGCAMMMPQGSSGTLHDLVVAYAKRAESMPQLVAMHYAIEMLRFCRGMHKVAILHMDMKPDNWLLTPPFGTAQVVRKGQALQRRAHSLSLIDFGGAIDLSVYPENGSRIEFRGSYCARNFSCAAMRKGLAWKHDADLFALGSCIYFMLHGTYLEVRLDPQRQQAPVSGESGQRWRPAQHCRRYWEVHLWDNLFDELLNVDHRNADLAQTEAMLARLEESLVSYIRDCPQRSDQLRDLLRQQDNMLSNR